MIRFEGMRSYIRDIKDLLHHYWRRFPPFFLLFLVSASMDIMGLSVLGPYIALVTMPESGAARSLSGFLEAWMPEGTAILVVLSWALVVIYGLKLIISLLVNFRIAHFGGQMDAYLRKELLRRFQAMPYGEWLQRNSSEYITAINSHVPTFIYHFLMPGMKAIADATVAVGVLVFLAYSDWRAFLVILSTLGLAAFVYDRLFRTRLARYGARQWQLQMNMMTGVRHAMEGIKELRVLGKEGYYNRILEKDAGEYAGLEARIVTINSMPANITQYMLILFIVLSVVIAWSVVGHTKNLAPVFGVFAFGALRLMPATNSLMIFGGHIRRQRKLIAQLAHDWRELGPDVSITSTGYNVDQDGESVFDSLSAKNISFRYPNIREYALDDISLIIKSGESIGLIGASGSGKSTLVDVLMGLLKADAGQIRVNGRPLEEDPRRLLDHVAYLPQHVFLVDDTVRHNVALGVDEEDIDDERVLKALDQAELRQIIEELPEGVDTVIGDRGLRLSGGQRQRVSLARAFYHRKSIIVMDEATSALDNETEKEIVDEINLLKGKTTLIVIAHRLTTVKNCDRIYRLERGKIIESGSYEQVLGC